MYIFTYLQFIVCVGGLRDMYMMAVYSSHNIHVEVRVQLCEAGSLIPSLCKRRGSRLSLQVALSAESSRWPYLFIIFEARFHVADMALNSLYSQRGPSDPPASTSWVLVL